MSAVDHGHGSATVERKFPPISELAVAALACLILSGIYLASHLPKHVSFTPSLVLIIIAAVLVATNVYLVSSLKNFAWGTFKQVAKWTLVAYGIIAGILEYVFIYDKVRGTMLALFTVTLFLFAVNLTIHFGFSVARYQEV